VKAKQRVKAMLGRTSQFWLTVGRLRSNFVATGLDAANNSVQPDGDRGNVG
jgi:hypothetical protein